MTDRNITIEAFCDRHSACRKGREWALSQGVTTMAELWGKDIIPEWRAWIVTRPGVMSDRELRLFACWRVRRMWHLLTDERSRNSVEVAERFARGEATRDELEAARAAAYAAYDSYASAYAAACSSFCYSSYADTNAAADAAAYAAYAACASAQNQYLIDLGNPFEKEI